eukprot:gene7638-792_t
MPRTVGETRTIPVDSAVWVDLVIRNKTHPDAGMMNNTDPTIVQSHQQFMPCVFCKSRHIALLDGMVTCQECHSVVDRIIDYGAEWRFFGTVSDGGGVGTGRNMTRCCPPSNSLIPTLGSVIGSGAQSSTPSTTTLAMGGRAKQRSCTDIQRYHFWNSMTYKERTLCSVFEQLAAIALRNGIPQIILKEAKGVYKKASSVKVTRGDNRKAIITCSMYMACKLNHVPRSCKEIGELFGVSSKIVIRGCKLIESRVDDLEVSTSRPEDYIRRFCSKLQMDEIERAFTQHIVDNIVESDLVCDFMPTSVAAGALYMTNLELNVGLSRADIAQACYLSTQSDCSSDSNHTNHNDSQDSLNQSDADIPHVLQSDTDIPHVDAHFGDPLVMDEIMYVALPVGELTGQVKWFNDRLGYGFCTVINDSVHKGRDIFVHHSGIRPLTSNYKTLRKGEYINLNVMNGHNGRSYAEQNEVSVIAGKTDDVKNASRKGSACKTVVGKGSCGKTVVGKGSAGKGSAGKAVVGKAVSRKVSVGKAVGDQVGVGKAVSRKVSVGKAVSRKVSVGKAVGDQAGFFTALGVIAAFAVVDLIAGAFGGGDNSGGNDDSPKENDAAADDAVADDEEDVFGDNDDDIFADIDNDIGGNFQTASSETIDNAKRPKRTVDKNNLYSAVQQQAEAEKQAAVYAAVKAAQQQAEDGKQAAVDAAVKAVQQQAEAEKQAAVYAAVKAAQQQAEDGKQAAVDAAVKAAQQQAEDGKQAAVDAAVKAAQQQAEDGKQAAVDAAVKAAQQQAEDGKQAAVDAVVKAAQQQADAAKKLWGMMRLREENKDAQFQQELTEMFNKLERKECIIRKHEASINAIRCVLRKRMHVAVSRRAAMRFACGEQFHHQISFCPP